MINIISLTFGFAESSYPGFLVFRNNTNKFKTKFDALHSLAVLLFNKYKKSIYYNQCCLLSQKLKDNFCSKCGLRIDNVDVTVDIFMNWVVKLSNSQTHIWGGDWIEDDWWPWCSMSEILKVKKSNILVINCQAEKYLAYTFDGTEYDLPPWKQSINEMSWKQSINEMWADREAWKQSINEMWADREDHYSSYNKGKDNGSLEHFKRQLNATEVDEII